MDFSLLVKDIPKDDLENQIKVVRPPSIKRLLAKYPIKKKNRTK